MKEKIDPFESLRGIAAIAVALYHFRCYSLLTDNLFIAHAELMVDFFFVLSGFVIAYNYEERLGSTKELFVFQTKRFWRLYPLHIITLVGFLGIELAKYFFEQKTGNTSTFPAFSINNTGVFIQHVFMLHAVIGDGRSFNYPSWSISSEFYTYLIFAILTVYGKKMRWFLFGSLVLISSIWVGGIVQINLDEYPMLRCTFSFFMGTLSWLICKKWKQKRQLPGGVPIIFIILSVAAICYLRSPYQRVICPMLFLGIIVSIYLSKRDSKLWKMLSVKPLVFLGTISYSIYMVHAGFWWVLTQIFRFSLKVPTESIAGKGTYIILTQPAATTVTIFGIIAIIFISSLTYRLIENPFRRGLPKK